MSVTVIDFGPVDWAKIWQDRAGLVSDTHLKELNQITNATHLSSPGYWRNLFASYPEVVAKAGLIVARYTLPGREPRHFSTEMRTPMVTPMQANKQTEDKRAQTLHEIEDLQREAAELEKHPFKKAYYMVRAEVTEVPVVKSAGEIVQNVGDTLNNVTTAAKNVTNYARNLSSDLTGVTANPIYLTGAIAAGAFLLLKISQ